MKDHLRREYDYNCSPNIGSTPQVKSLESPTGELSEKQLAAEALLARGFSVLPLWGVTKGKCDCNVWGCGHIGKHPHKLAPNGFKSASNKLDDIDSWWGENPNCNIGIAIVDGIIAIDVDSYQGAKILLEDQGRLGTLPKTLTNQTGKGCHLIFGVDPDAKITNSTPAHWNDHIHLRGNGTGYIVGPGSAHYSGWKYKFVDPNTSIATLPKTWADMFINAKTAPAPQPVNGNGDANEKLKTDEGRNNAVSKEVYKLRKIGISGEVLFKAAQQINRRICHPRHLLPDSVIRSMCRSKDKNVTPDPVRVTAPAPALIGDKNNLLSPGKADEFFSNHGISCDDLMALDIPPMKWTVEKILPEGLTLFVGAPKLGKSLFCLDISIVVSNGTKLFGEFQSQCGVVLYLALEDGNRRLQYRIDKMTDKYSNRLKLFTKWAQINSTGEFNAIDLLERFLDKEPETNLVIVDTIGKLSLEKKTTKDIYISDVKRLEGFQQLAIKKNISILVVHHTNKGDHRDEYNSVSGSNGLSGTADQLWKLDRSDRNENEATLSISGRDVEPIRAALEMDPNTFTWKWLGCAKDRDSRKAADKILDVLQNQAKPLSHSKIGELTDLKAGTIKGTISRLRETGKIRQAVGRPGHFVLAPGASIAYM
ncbi:MAG: bifunctional DNA primase/polymerase [Desulfomonilaceae bacterium]|jgi:hypothetical protein